MDGSKTFLCLIKKKKFLFVLKVPNHCCTWFILLVWPFYSDLNLVIFHLKTASAMFYNFEPWYTPCISILLFWTLIYSLYFHITAQTLIYSLHFHITAQTSILSLYFYITTPNLYYNITTLNLDTLPVFADSLGQEPEAAARSARLEVSPQDG